MSYKRFKVLLAGDGAVGKTSILQRFLQDKFIQDYQSTVGVEVFTKDIKYNGGDIATLSIWDVAGQEQYNFMRNNFYYGTDGLLLVFDLTRHETFKHMHKWLEEIHSHTGDDVPFILIGNKADLLEEVGEVIDDNEACDLASQFDTLYLKTSAKTGLHIDNVFHKLTELIIKGKTFSTDFYKSMWKKGNK